MALFEKHISVWKVGNLFEKSDSSYQIQDSGVL